MSTKARNQPAKSPCSYASNWSMCYPSNCPQFTCIKVKSDLEKLKIKDQRSRSFEKITTGDLYPPKDQDHQWWSWRSRSKIVIFAHLCCRSTGSSRPRRRRRLLRRPCCRPLAFARLSSVLSRSVRCFDVACSAVGNSLVGPRNVGLSLPSSSPFSFRSAFANVLRAARSLANITRNYYL